MPCFFSPDLTFFNIVRSLEPSARFQEPLCIAALLMVRSYEVAGLVSALESSESSCVWIVWLGGHTTVSSNTPYRCSRLLYGVFHRLLQDVPGFWLGITKLHSCLEAQTWQLWLRACLEIILVVGGFAPRECKDACRPGVFKGFSRCLSSACSLNVRSLFQALLCAGSVPSRSKLKV